MPPRRSSNPGREPTMPPPSLKLVPKAAPPRAPVKAIEPPSEKYLAEPMPLANYDRAIRAAVARASRGIAWPSLVSAWADWYSTSGSRSRQADGAGQQGATQGGPLRAVRAGVRAGRQHTLHPTPAAGPSLRRSSLAGVSVQPDASVVPADAAVGLECDQSTCVGVSRHHERMVTFTARQALDIGEPDQFRLDQPRDACRGRWKPAAKTCFRA